MLAAVLAVSALAVLAVPASAAVPAANTEVLHRGREDRQHDRRAGVTQAQAKKLVSQFKTAAKYAPAKVKAAISKIAK